MFLGHIADVITLALCGALFSLDTAKDNSRDLFEWSRSEGEARERERERERERKREKD